MNTAERHGKDYRMATTIAEAVQDMKPGCVVGVAGATQEHAERLIALVHSIAAKRGLDVEHVSFKALVTELVSRESERGH